MEATPIQKSAPRSTSDQRETAWSALRWGARGLATAGAGQASPFRNLIPAAALGYELDAGGYEVRVGRARPSAEVLSDDALENLAARAASEPWSDKRRLRLDRLAHRAALLRADASALRRAA